MTEKSPTICTNCKHVNKAFDDFHTWSCLVLFEQELNYVTGEMRPARIYCSTKNMDGNCQDFEEADDETR